MIHALHFHPPIRVQLADCFSRSANGARTAKPASAAALLFPPRRLNPRAPLNAHLPLHRSESALPQMAKTFSARKRRPRPRRKPEAKSLSLKVEIHRQKCLRSKWQGSGLARLSPANPLQARELQKSVRGCSRCVLVSSACFGFSLQESRGKSPLFGKAPTPGWRTHERSDGKGSSGALDGGSSRSRTW